MILTSTFPSRIFLYPERRNHIYTRHSLAATARVLRLRGATLTTQDMLCNVPTRLWSCDFTKYLSGPMKEAVQ